MYQIYIKDKYQIVTYQHTRYRQLNNRKITNRQHITHTHTCKNTYTKYSSVCHQSTGQHTPGRPKSSGKRVVGTMIVHEHIYMCECSNIKTSYIPTHETNINSLIIKDRKESDEWLRWCSHQICMRKKNKWQQLEWKQVKLYVFKVIKEMVHMIVGNTIQ